MKQKLNETNTKLLDVKETLVQFNKIYININQLKGSVINQWHIILVFGIKLRYLRCIIDFLFFLICYLLGHDYK